MGLERWLSTDCFCGGLRFSSQHPGGSSHPSVTLTLGSPCPLLASVSNRPTHGAYTNLHASIGVCFFCCGKDCDLATEKGKRFTHPDYSRSLRKSGEELKVETWRQELTRGPWGNTACLLVAPCGSFILLSFTMKDHLFRMGTAHWGLVPSH